MFTVKHPLLQNDPSLLFPRLGMPSPCFLLESLSVSDRFGRLSLAGWDPTLEIKAKDGDVHIRLLAARGLPFFEDLATQFAGYVEAQNPQSLKLHIPCPPYTGDEDKRVHRQNSVIVIRHLLQQFQRADKTFMGLYGTLAYRFVYLFEDVPFSHETDVPDFHLFLYDTFVHYNHLTSECHAIACRPTEEAAEDAVHRVAEVVAEACSYVPKATKLKDATLEPDEATFKDQVAQAKELFRQGELMEIVLCRRLSAQLIGKPWDLYLAYRAHNPSPYLFYFDLGNAEQLLGASPEMMLRYENGKVTLRPISGTAPRGKTPMEDHANMMALLNSTKEKAELDMLIDLGRNDVARICEPGVEIADYRYVEKYTRVMHTVAQVSGRLQANKTGLDALIASLNAGTLTGAPKVAAMRYIEQMEPFARGYYGGTAGYFSLSGEVDTGIIIRSAHIQDGKLTYCSGATLLIDCEPEFELRETQIKAQAFMDLFTNES